METTSNLTLAEIFKDSNYKLTQFSLENIQVLEEGITVRETRGKDTPYINCIVRKKEIKLTPEEAVRQLYIMVLVDDFGYPTDRMELSMRFLLVVKRKELTLSYSTKIKPPPHT